MEREPHTSDGKNICAKMIAIKIMTHVTPKAGAKPPFTTLNNCADPQKHGGLNGSNGEHPQLGRQSSVSSKDSIHRIDQGVAQRGQNEESEGGHLEGLSVHF